MTTFSKAGTSGVRRPLAIVGVTALTLALALLLAPRSHAGGGIVVHKLDGGERLSRSEIRKAEPLDPIMRKLPAGGAEASGARSAGKPQGKPGYVEGYMPPQIATAQAARGAAQGARGFGSFTSRPVSTPGTYPNTANGRVIGTIQGVGTYSCSATVVHGKNRSTIFTAGHCVKEPRGNFASALIFIPSYNRGNEPFGRFQGRYLLVKKAWAKKGNSNFDYAAVKVAPNGLGRVEEVVGSLGFAYNVKPKRKQFRAVGYPFNKFDTQVMWECSDKFAGFDPGYRKPGPKPIGIGCDMLGGASGGGWTIPGMYLNSVTSFGYDQLPNHLYGPQFSRAADKLRKAVGKR